MRFLLNIFIIPFFCVLFCFFVVYPIWFFAHTWTTAFSILTLIGFIVFIAYLFFNKIHMSLHLDSPCKSEYKDRIKNLFKTVFSVLLLFIACILAVLFILNFKRVLALSILFCGFIVFFVLKKIL